MKSRILIISLVLSVQILHSTPNVFAVSPTTTITPAISNSEKNESLVQQINELKDKIASRVASMKLVEKRGVIGTVTEISDTRITLTNSSGDIKIIDVDELTKFSSAGKDEFGISDITKGTTLSVMGLYNKQSKHILARYVSTFTLPFYIAGSITEVNSDDFTITVSGKENKITIIDIERTTKIDTYTTSNTIQKIGFSKLVEGDRVTIVGYSGKTDTARVAASYVLQLNDLSTAQDLSPTTTPGQ